MEGKIPHWLDKRFELSPDQTAIQLKNGKIYTFRQLRADAIAFAGKMKTLGIQRGDHVGILSRNSYEMVVAIHALSYVEAIGVLLNTRLTVREWSFQLKDSDTSYLLYDHHFKKEIAALKEHVNIKAYSVNDVKSVRKTSIPLPDEMDLGQTFTIIYTSGTTGFPKGVQLTYGNHWWSAVSSALNLGIHEHDRWLLALPLFHVGGLSILIRSLAYGMPVHLYEKFDAEAINREIIENGVSIVSGRFRHA